jgi:hypothetical protein
MGCSIATKRMPPSDSTTVKNNRKRRMHGAPLQWASIYACSPDEDAMQAQFRRLWSLKEVGGHEGCLAGRLL